MSLTHVYYATKPKHQVGRAGHITTLRSGVRRLLRHASREGARWNWSPGGRGGRGDPPTRWGSGWSPLSFVLALYPENIGVDAGILELLCAIWRNFMPISWKVLRVCTQLGMCLSPLRNCWKMYFCSRHANITTWDNSRCLAWYLIALVLHECMQRAFL